MKYKFVKIKDEKNEFDTTKVVIYSDATSLSDLIDNFSDFLKACGYSFDSLEIFYNGDDNE